MTAKKNFYAAAAVLTAVLAVSTPIVYGHSNTNGENKGEAKQLEKVEKLIEKLDKFEIPALESSTSHPSSIVITPQGKININNGEVVSIASTTLEVKAWGLKFSVETGEARFIPENTVLSDLQVGDKINLKGQISADNSIVKAEKIHALSLKTRATDKLKSQIDELLKKIEELKKKLQALGGQTQ